MEPRPPADSWRSAGATTPSRALPEWPARQTESTSMLIAGSCHCANIRFTLDWQPEPVEIPARACGCSFCVKHGGVWTSCPTGRLRVTVSRPERVAHYEFGTKTAQFHVCMDCGITPVVTSRIAGRLHAVVSVNAF